MKSVVAFLPELSPPAVVVCVLPPVFDDPLQILHIREKLSKVPELQGFRLALAVAPNATGQARFDGEQDLVVSLFRIGWLRLPLREVELTFS
jgi:hypothetical protein